MPLARRQPGAVILHPPPAWGSTQRTVGPSRLSASFGPCGGMAFGSNMRITLIIVVGREIDPPSASRSGSDQQRQPLQLPPNRRRFRTTHGELLTTLLTSGVGHAASGS